MAFLTGYQRSEAQICATLCKIAYLEENSKNYSTIKNAIQATLSNASAPFTSNNWQLCWLGISPDFANLMFLAADKTHPGTYAIAHRGTDWSYLDDVKEDMDVYNTSSLNFLRPPHPDIYVAAGASDGLAVLQEMKDYTTPVAGITGPAGILDVIRSFIGPAANELNFLITGHSLGGALATIFTTWLLEMLTELGPVPNPINLKTYTIASPTVGNSAYASYYNSKMTAPGSIPFEGYRIYNLQDLVPAAFADLPELPDNGIPVGILMKEVLKTAVLGVTGTLKLEGLSYVHAGVEKGFVNIPPKTPPPCDSIATGLKQYGCWVSYEHSLDTYLPLI